MSRLLAALLLLPHASSAQESLRRLADNGLAPEAGARAVRPVAGDAPGGSGAAAGPSRGALAQEGGAAWAARGSIRLFRETFVLPAEDAGTSSDEDRIPPLGFATIGTVKLGACLEAPLGVLPPARSLAVIGYLRLELPEQWKAKGLRGGEGEGAEADVAEGNGAEGQAVVASAE